MTPLAPMKSTIPNSLTVSSRQRLPPAIAAGSAAGRMTLRTIRQGLAPRRPATSIWLWSTSEKAASSGRSTNGV